jgi:hypothetical protein
MLGLWARSKLLAANVPGKRRGKAFLICDIGTIHSTVRSDGDRTNCLASEGLKPIGRS